MSRRRRTWRDHLPRKVQLPADAVLLQLDPQGTLDVDGVNYLPVRYSVIYTDWISGTPIQTICSDYNLRIDEADDILRLQANARERNSRKRHAKANNQRPKEARETTTVS